jgi:hypothetical protein
MGTTGAERDEAKEKEVYPSGRRYKRAVERDYPTKMDPAAAGPDKSGSAPKYLPGAKQATERYKLKYGN